MFPFPGLILSFATAVFLAPEKILFSRGFFVLVAIIII